MNMTQPTRIWIVRKGNGKVQVHPSPATLSHGSSFTIRNLTGNLATVNFRDKGIDPDEARLAAGQTSTAFTVGGAAPPYIEYDVTLDNGEYAEGGSKPGAIIDP